MMGSQQGESAKWVKCELTGQKLERARAIPINHLRSSLVGQIQADNPSADLNGFVSHDALNSVRLQVIEAMIRTDRGEITALQQEVLDTISSGKIFAHDPLGDADSQSTVGQRLADKVASFGGSWTFIGVFFCVLLLWIVVNSTALIGKPFDPYPFILMNLILSCLAAIQAPVIMMSQNRQEAKDRLRSEHDYQINLKAELEIQLLREGLERLAGHQWQQLLEIQQMQVDMISELHAQKSSKTKDEEN